MKMVFMIILKMKIPELLFSKQTGMQHPEQHQNEDEELNIDDHDKESKSKQIKVNPNI